MGSVMADHWTVEYNPSGSDPEEQTYVFAGLQVLDGNDWQNYAGSNYEIAAFIDGQVRAVLMEPNYSVLGQQVIWRFQVVGGQSEADAQKTITFKAYNKTRQVEYTLATTATFTGGNEGTASNPKVFQLKEPTALSLADFTLNVGETQNLMDKLTVTPADADMPSAFTWSTNASYSITNNVLTAVSPAKDGVDLTISLGELNATAKIYILQPATNLTFFDGTTSFSGVMYVGDDLTSVLSDPDFCILTPSNTTDEVVWTSNDDDIVEITAGVAVIKAPGNVVLTGSVNRAGVSDITFNLQVKQHVTSLTTPFIYNYASSKGKFLYCNLGEDLAPYFVDGKIFNILPGNASNKEVTVTKTDGYENAFNIADGKILAIKEGISQLTVTSEDDPSLSVVVDIYVRNDITDVNFVKNNLTVLYAGIAKDITSDVVSNILFTTPTDADADFYGGPYVQSNDASVLTIDGVNYMRQTGLTLLAQAEGLGTATVTVSFDKKDYLQANFDDTKTYVTTVQKSFTVQVAAQLVGLTYNVPTLVVGKPSVVEVYPDPVQAVIDPDELGMTATCGFKEQWGAASSITGPVLNATTGAYEFTITPKFPGSVELRFYYHDGKTPYDEADTYYVDAPMDFKKGWQWKTIYFGGTFNAPYNLDGVFGTYNKSVVHEIRTENEEVLNDDVYGYFGDTNLLTLNKCFKVNMTASYSCDFSGTQFYGYVDNINVHYGWNWIPNPFFYNRLISNGFIGLQPVQGDVILSKEDGFAEYDGNAWQGSLTLLKRGEGYLYFSNAAEPKKVNIGLEGEGDMEEDEDDDSNAGAPSFDLDGVSQPQFTVDASRFANNMAIVAELDNVSRPENFMVVAYVGDECRGTGSCYNGKMFITVHADKGETISFRLFNRTTGELSDMDQTVRMTARLGSLKEPFRLSSETVSTGIENLQTRQSDSKSAQRYDLGGRVVTGAAKGVSIQRGNDGKVRKVIVK